MASCLVLNVCPCFHVLRLTQTCVCLVCTGVLTVFEFFLYYYCPVDAFLNYMMHSFDHPIIFTVLAELVFIAVS